jgi:D-alanine-D-alanine ligase
MRVGVTFDLRSEYLALGLGDEETAEFDAEETVEAICRTLRGMGHEAIRIGNVKQLAQALVAGARFDCVFNICEGLRGAGREAQVPALLDAYDIPYVFSDPLTLSVALDKATAKHVVRDQGVPTPDFFLIERVEDCDRVELPFPLFLKPNCEGSGKGVNAKSKVDNKKALRSVARELLDRFEQPVLVETYLPGREFTVAITGTGADAVVLGVSEIGRKANFVGHGYGYQNKEYWTDKVSIELCEDDEGKAAAEVALAAWRALRCRDGGRVDIRNDANGKPNFIEVNPLAGLRPEYSDMCFIAGFKGVSYDELIRRIVNSFLKRHPHLSARAHAA